MAQQYSAPPAMTLDDSKSYSATFKTNHGDIEIELFRSQAPVTVNNFVFLARDGFYNDVIIHRVIPGFMIQGGDPDGTGMGGPGYKFQDEFDTSLTFGTTGILAMANSGPATNGSQFFITVAPTPHLNGKHTIFGKVTSGQDIADAISNVAQASGNRPTEPIVIERIEIQES
ncbi:MAG: peptidylprolyl isomerase [Dehalococcoidia bacterium]|jgi:cyclophilin family peptidyl-prolyl cis-trans isomerase|nr:peptidylprolyl isomerase [Dehalococcoidia bacterium]|tara:strand:- start:377 stop:892 length:516 start_codon:yes stop_codon:yes gene_type:complete